jgi:hypothetical protein
MIMPDPNQNIPVLRFGIWTGGDDCRSDSRVYAFIYYKDGRPLDIGLLKDTGTTWDNNSFHEVEVLLVENTKAGDLSQIQIMFFQGGGGWNGDNWNMDGIAVWIPTPDANWALVFQEFGSPLKRFTGHDTVFTIPWQIAATAALEAKMLKVRHPDRALEPLSPMIFAEPVLLGRAARASTK